MKALVLSLIIAFTGSFAMAGGPGCAAGTIGSNHGKYTKNNSPAKGQPAGLANASVNR